MKEDIDWNLVCLMICMSAIVITAMIILGLFKD